MSILRKERTDCVYWWQQATDINWGGINFRESSRKQQLCITSENQKLKQMTDAEQPEYNIMKMQVISRQTTLIL